MSRYVETLLFCEMLNLWNVFPTSGFVDNTDVCSGLKRRPKCETQQIYHYFQLSVKYLFHKLSIKSLFQSTHDCFVWAAVQLPNDFSDYQIIKIKTIDNWTDSYRPLCLSRNTFCFIIMKSYAGNPWLVFSSWVSTGRTGPNAERQKNIQTLWSHSSHFWFHHFDI